MYDRAFRKWKDFALRKKELSYFLANPMHVAVYLQYVLESTRSSASVDTAFYSIKWAHESAGLVSPTDNPLVSSVRDAAKRILGTKRGQVRLPRLPVVEWAIASFRGMGDGRVFQPRTAMLKILHLGFQYLNP